MHPIVFPLSPRRPIRGIALISTLAIIAIVTVMLVSFVSVVNQDRNATQNYSQGLRADQIARGGLDSIVDLLRQEATDRNFNDYTNSSDTNYAMYAATNSSNFTNGTNLFPQHLGGTNNPTIVAYSGTNIYESGGTEMKIPVAAGVYTTNASLNGRSITPSRWNQSYMVTNVADFPPVQWTLVTRAGVNTNALTVQDVVTNALSNDKFVVGRYAYVVYDTSGLIDINVAGNPSSPGAAVPKGTLPWADLTALPGITGADVQKLVQWRNPTTGTTTSAYAAYITNTWMTSGFMRTANGDNAFLSRQDLIHYATSQNTSLTNALPYLTTFSRAVNGPTWGPRVNGGGAYTYLQNQMLNNSTNPLAFKALVTTDGWTRNNGTIAHKGEPLAMYRFPLDKLALLEVGTDTTSIQKYFGLDMISVSSGSTYRYWSYPTQSTQYQHKQNYIYTLDEVAALTKPREPDFFEMLKAAIYSGSLGDSGGRGDGNVNVPAICGYPAAGDMSASADAHIIQIGANIIDQWDKDDFPTRIAFAQFSIYGMEDLPYMEQIFFNFDRTDSSATNPQYFANMYFSLWSPYQPRVNNLSNVVPLNLRLEVGNLGIYQIMYGSNALTAGANYEPEFYNYTQVGIYTNSWTGWSAANNTTGTNNWKNPNFSPGGYFTFTYNPTNSTTSLYRTNTFLKNAANNLGSSVYNMKPQYYTGNINEYKMPYPVLCALSPGTTSASLTPDGGGTISTTDPYPTAKWKGYLILENFVPMMSIQDPSGGASSYYPYNFFSGFTLTNSLYSTNVVNGNFFGGQTHYAGIWGPIPPVAFPSPLTRKSYFVMLSDPSATPGMDANLVKADPRMARWGAYQSTGGLTASNSVAGYTIPDYYLPSNMSTNTRFGASMPSVRYNTPYNLSQWQVNTNTALGTAAPGYQDLDGIQRPGDNASVASAGLLTPASTTMAVAGDAHPIMLNRAFNSVGDLGYTYRDLPWRSLDFASTNSADSGLLDFFSMSEAPVLAGQVNPNTPYVSVLTALLSGSAYAEGVTTAIDTNTISATATSIWTYLSNNPVMNRGDLPAAIQNSGAYATLGYYSPAGVTLGGAPKTQREALIRALAEVSNTRTWNFMIDIIAQSGRYPAGAKSLDNFVVTGERRYWLHVAIDRYTGKVVDEMLEKVGD